LGIIFLCLCSAYILWLDYQIQTRFEGKRWALPARVYASPLEIYPGQILPREQIEKELLAVGFEKNAHLDNAGQYRFSSNNLEFIKRQFSYWDDYEPSESVKIKFKGDQISEISSISNDRELNLVRLEPQLIGKIYPDHNEDRVLVAENEIPRSLDAALFAIEDRNFLHHHGIDFRGVARAMITNIRKGRITQGGSTLTQQLVKNYFLTPERSFRRKFNEMIMAMLLELRYSKAEIFTAYVNEIYLGQSGARAIHGFGMAAEFYFAKPLNELRLDQIALLAGIVRGASYYNPRRHPQRAQERRNLVLQIMNELGYIAEDELHTASSTPLDISKKPLWSSARFPAFQGLVRRHLLKDYLMEDLKNEGLRIFTTLVPHIQESTQHAATKKLEEIEKQKSMKPDSLQMATVVVHIATGEVMAVVGGRNGNVGDFNRALDANRQIGSLIKPAIYLSALSIPEKYNLLTLLDDSPIRVPQEDGDLWQPRNYDRNYHGDVLLLDSLKNSYNVATVRLGLDIGLEKVISTLHDAGIRKEISPYPSLLLGALDLAPVDVAQMYQTIANGGFQSPLNSIREVLDSSGRPLQRYGLKVNQTLHPPAVYLTNYILQEVINSGTGKSLKRIMAGRLPLAGKTGTTNDLRDSWFAGFGDSVLAITWMGRDDDKPAGFTGATGAMLLWSEIMKSIHVQALNMPEPEEIKWYRSRNKVLPKACRGLDKIPYLDNGRSFATQICRN